MASPVERWQPALLCLISCQKNPVTNCQFSLRGCWVCIEGGLRQEITLRFYVPSLDVAPYHWGFLSLDSWPLTYWCTYFMEDVPLWRAATHYLWPFVVERFIVKRFLHGYMPSFMASVHHWRALSLWENLCITWGVSSLIYRAIPPWRCFMPCITPFEDS